MDLVPDDHEPDEEGNYVELRLDFHPPEGDEMPVLAQVQIHSHHVPDNLYIDTLLVLAREHMKKTMAENMFKESVPEAVRAFAAGLMANKYLAQRLEDPTLGATQPIDFKVPDDARELFDND
jgi:hypothetical protein